MTDFQRVIHLKGANNIRDLGGYLTAGGGRTRWRSLLRGDALHRLNDADVLALRAQGLSAVIDLRSDREVKVQVNPFTSHPNVAYSNVQLFSALAPAEMMANATAGFSMGHRYCHALDECQEAIANVLTAIADAPDGAVLFHCTAGKDRTGIIAALLLANAGVAAETIIEDYFLTADTAPGLLAELRHGAVRRGMDPSVVEAIFAVDPASMARMLSHLEDAHGGIEHYMTKLGLDASVKTRLRQRFL
jgi:protein-tyrosine phosphatase